MLSAMRRLSSPSSPSPVTCRRALRSSALAIAALGLVAACGDDIAANYNNLYANRCAAPRSGESPITGRAYRDTKGSHEQEKRFVREWIDDLYLWYREVPDADPAEFETAPDYFEVLKTPASTPSGRPKDQFHFLYPSAEWEALSQRGVSAGYGVQWVLLSSRPPREIVAAYVDPGSPADANGIRRGTKVLTVDGVDVERGTDVDTLNAGLFPDELGVAHTFVVRDVGQTSTRPITMTSAEVTSQPVQEVKVLPYENRTIGYVAFHDHIATAEKQLATALEQLRNNEVEDLVLDLRYNGGGYLVIASQLSYMIAGATRVLGKGFETLVYNDRYQTFDPFSGQPIGPQSFRTTGVGLSLPSGQGLPTLNLSRVVVITGPGTCSASESIINGLRGIDVEVILIGGTTCGKPYGFYPRDNCGTTYFAIQFQGVNHKGFGDYADGFVPGGSGASGVKGCVVADDFTRELGDPTERRLAAALAYLHTGACPAQTIARPTSPNERDLSAVTELVVPKSPGLQNRLVLEPGLDRR